MNFKYDHTFMQTRFFYILISFWLILSLIIGFWLIVPSQLSSTKAHFSAKRAIVQKLLLTDYCLSTESRHTRHLSMPEWIAPFQDLPGYMDHFPSSTLIRPPQK